MGKEKKNRQLEKEIKLRKLYAGFICALCIFGYFGMLGISPDVDSIWEILGLEAPFTFVLTEGRNCHTPLLFICVALVSSIIGTALAFRLGFIWRLLDVSDS